MGKLVSQDKLVTYSDLIPMSSRDILDRSNKDSEDIMQGSLQHVLCEEDLENWKDFLGDASTQTRKKYFLVEVVKSVGVILRASKLTGVSLTTHARWRRTDKQYEEVFKSLKSLVLDIQADIIQDAVISRVLAGDGNVIAKMMQVHSKRLGYEGSDAQSEITVSKVKRMSDAELDEQLNRLIYD